MTNETGGTREQRVWDKETERQRKAEYRLRKRQRDAERALVVAGAEQASHEKHESVTQKDDRVARALKHHDWLLTTRSLLEPDATEAQIKEFYGYTPSETRTETERTEAANRMVLKTQGHAGQPG